MSTTTEQYPGVEEYGVDFRDEDPTIVIDAIRFPRGKNVALPTCDGPKLRPFRPFGKLDNLEWVRQVSVTDMSVVWKAKIDGEIYCLKLGGCH